MLKGFFVEQTSFCFHGHLAIVGRLNSPAPPFPPVITVHKTQQKTVIKQHVFDHVGVLCMVPTMFSHNVIFMYICWLMYEVARLAVLSLSSQGVELTGHGRSPVRVDVWCQIDTLILFDIRISERSCSISQQFSFGGLHCRCFSSMHVCIKGMMFR
jgi:hypothetical protein